MTKAKLKLDLSRRLTREERRLAKIAIAKDILARLKIGNLHDDRGCYLSVPQYIMDDIDNPQEDIDEIEQNCYVCALGAAFLSHIRLFNHVPIEDVGNSGKVMVKHLKKIFTEHELGKIEAAYEGATVVMNLPFYKTSRIKNEYGNHYNEEYSLKEIFQSIVRNNGSVKLKVRRLKPKKRA